MDTHHNVKRALSAAALALGVLVVAEEASAIIGRPFTPMSYAGVARRTTRRAVYGGAMVGAAYGATYGATYGALPAGCAMVGALYGCGGTYYQQVYDGPNVVY